jgi:hypothetical protein
MKNGWNFISKLDILFHGFVPRHMCISLIYMLMWISYCNTHTDVFIKVSVVSDGIHLQVRRVFPSVLLVVLVVQSLCQCTFTTRTIKALIL